MKIPKFFLRKKLHASTRSLPRRADEPDEPNMKLTSAVIVVIMLHLVAVGGIYAFSSIKAHRLSSFEKAAPNPAPAVVKAPALTTEKTQPAHESRSAKPTPKLLAEKTSDSKKSASAVKHLSPGASKDSGEIYTVGKGENPVAIAKKLGVNYDDLLRLNKLDDPKKLQIGQKLHVPTKRSATHGDT